MSGYSSDWISDSFPHYRLTRRIVLDFLKGKFGQSGQFSDSDFDVKLSSDDYTFKVPRKLTKAERTELERKRPRDNDDEDL